jgi:hypothetical protein
MKALAIVRDGVVVIGMLVLCAAGVFDVSEHLRARAEQETRLTLMRNAIEKLDEAYKQTVFNSSENKGIYQQMFRQNEILLEYQKLLLTSPYLPARETWRPTVTPASRN